MESAGVNQLTGCASTTASGTPNPIGAIRPTPPGTKPGSQTITARDIGTPAPYTTHHTAHATTRTRMVIAGDRRVGSSSQMGNMTHSEMPH